VLTWTSTRRTTIGSSNHAVRNSSEPKRPQAILRRRKARTPDARAQIAAALDAGDRAAGPLASLVTRYLESRKRSVRQACRDPLRRLLLRVAAETELLDDPASEDGFADCVARLAGHHERWLRQPEAWTARSHNAAGSSRRSRVTCSPATTCRRYGRRLARQHE
jgi:hypothetical protein